MLALRVLYYKWLIVSRDGIICWRCLDSTRDILEHTIFKLDNYTHNLCIEIHTLIQPVQGGRHYRTCEQIIISGEISRIQSIGIAQFVLTLISNQIESERCHRALQGRLTIQRIYTSSPRKIRLIIF